MKLGLARGLRRYLIAGLLFWVPAGLTWLTFKFLLDLTEVTYIDSFGVGVIAAKYVSVRRKGGDVKLLRLSPRSRRVMRISGLLKIFQSFDNEEDGVKSFRAGA